MSGMSKDRRIRWIPWY